jgi:hypothetical protein
MKTIVFEYGKLSDAPALLNALPGIYKFTVRPENYFYTDDRSVTGFYSWTNTIYYDVTSIVIDNLQFLRTSSIDDCFLTSDSFYFDSLESKVYIHFQDGVPPLDKKIEFGFAVSYLYTKDHTPYVNDRYYEPRVVSLSGITKNIDQQFFGRLQYAESNVTLINNDAELDAWRDLDLYGTRARILYGESDTLEPMYEGNISDDSRNWQGLSVKVSDLRQGLTQKVATRILTVADYANIKDDAIGKTVPVHYGKIFDAPVYNVNTSNKTFMFTDATFNDVTSLDAVYVDGVLTSPTTTTLSAGTFAISGYTSGTVTCDFTMTITNGVAILTDLIQKVDGRTLTASFWNLAEVATAQAGARSTSIAIEGEALNEAIEKVLFDISGRFFVQDNGLFTVRLYDVNREPSTDINYYDWIGEPEIVNNATDFLSSVAIKYKKKQQANSFSIYTDTSLEQETFDRYRQKKNKEYETGLYTEAQTIQLSTDILSISTNIQDVVKRQVSWDFRTIELCDFIICDPVARVSHTEDKNIYEVIGIEKNLESLTVNLTLRYVKDYDPVLFIYSVLIDEFGALCVDNNNNTTILRDEVA